MDRNNELVAYLYIGGALAGAWFANVPALVWVLIALIALDMVTGLLAAGVSGTVDSAIGWNGIKRKVVVLLLVAMAAVWGIALEAQTGFPATGLIQAVAGFYAANEAISIIENAARAGVPVPQVLRDALAKLSPEPPGKAGRFDA